MQTLRMLAVVRFGHRPQTHRQDRLQYTAPQLASVQFNNIWSENLLTYLRQLPKQ